MHAVGTKPQVGPITHGFVEPAQLVEQRREEVLKLGVGRIGVTVGAQVAV
jgi:hypothetical protein